MLTLLQTGKRDMVPVVFLDEPGGKFWQPLIQILSRPNAGRRHDFARGSVALQADRHRRRGRRRRFCSFFRVYHSMRYVKNKLVFRLTSSISAELLADINASFRDILVDGQFTVGEAQREEKDEPALIALPRLMFHFNRRSLGRLRQLIDALNRGSVAEADGRQQAAGG